MLEVEVKIKTDLKSIVKLLTANGFQKGSTVCEYDTYFNGKNYDLKNADKALRIREYKNIDTGKVRYILNFKGPKVDNITMTREETQFEIPSFEAGQTVLNGLGYFAAGKVEKKRMHYIKEDITCCLDQVKRLGDFLEIEVMTEDTGYEQAITKIENILDLCGLNMADTTRNSYLSMLENKINK